MNRQPPPPRRGAPRDDPRATDPGAPAGARGDPSGAAATSSPLDALSSRPEVRERIKAYPGTLTYLDLIRRNRVESALLMAAMVGLAVAVGGLAASLLAVRGGAADDLPSLVPSILIGAFAGFGVAIVGCLWSWYGGANAILRMSGAREVQKHDDPELFNVVDEMRLAAGLPMPRVFIVNDTALNAFATGRDPARGVVAITRGLRERLTRDELQGVIAHEMAHIRHYDIRFAMLMATMVGLIVFACDAFLRIGLHRGMGGRGSRRGGKEGGIAVVVVMALAILLAILAPIAARFIQLAYSRRREYLADAGAVELTRNPLGLASALAKLADDAEPLVDGANRGTAHLYIVNPLRKMRRAHQALDTVWSSHPPVKQRIARLMALAR